MYKVVLDPGHGGRDNGAVKYLTEDVVNLAQAIAVRDFLLAVGGFEIWMSREADTATDLNATCRKCNTWNADIGVSIHNNAGGGDGFEAYYAKKSTKGKALAAAIEKRVKAAGQNSRGLKTKLNNLGTDYYGFNRIPRCPSVILEGCFVDNKKDAADFDTLQEQQAYGYAVARGICDYFGIKEKPVYRTLVDLNFRQENNLHCKTMGVIPAGTMVAGTLLLDGWLKTSYKGKTGYIRVKGQKEYAKRI